MDELLLRGLHTADVFLRTPRGGQLLALALVIAFFILICHLAVQALQKLNKSIKEARGQETESNPRGPYPTTTEGQIRQYERLIPVKRERDKNLQASVLQFAFAVMVLPPAMLIAVVYFSGILSLGQPNLQLASLCSCGPGIVDPTISQTMQFVVMSTVISPVGDWIAALFGPTDLVVELRPYSVLAVFLTAYKLALPTVAGGYIAKYLELTAAFEAISPRLRRLQNDLKAAGVLASTERDYNIWRTDGSEADYEPNTLHAPSR